MSEKQSIDIGAIKQALDESVITNAKLAHTLNIFNVYHLTKEEKNKIAVRIESASTLKELKEVHELIVSELDKRGYEDQDGNKWSPIFVHELIRPLIDGGDFEPINKIKEEILNIELYQQLDEKVSKLGKKEKENLKETIKKQKDNFKDSVKSLKEWADKIGPLIQSDQEP